MYLSAPEACEHLRISRETLTNLIKSGQLTAMKTGPSPKSRWRISVDSINEYIERNTIKPVDRPKASA